MKKTFFTKAFVAVGVMASALALSSMCVFAEVQTVSHTYTFGSSATASDTEDTDYFTVTNINDTKSDYIVLNKYNDSSSPSYIKFSTESAGATVSVSVLANGNSARNVDYYTDTTNKTLNNIGSANNKNGTVKTLTATLGDAGDYYICNEGGGVRYYYITVTDKEDSNAATPDLESVIITSTVTEVTEGKTLQLTASKNPSKADGTISWSSSNTNVATIDPSTGLLTAIAEGTTTVTAAVGDITATVDITVNPGVTVITGVTLTKSLSADTVANNVTLTNDKATISEDLEIDGFTIKASTDKTVLIDKTGANANGNSVSYRIATSGTATANGVRSISFTTENDNAKVYVWALSQNNSSDRTLNVWDSNGNVVGTIAAYGTTSLVDTSSAPGGYVELPTAGTYSVGSSNSGIGIYLIGLVDEATATNTVTKTSSLATPAVVADGTTYYAIAVISDANANASEVTISADDATPVKSNTVYGTVTINGVPYTANDLSTAGGAYLFAFKVESNGATTLSAEAIQNAVSVAVA